MVSLSPSELIQKIVKISLLFIATIFSKSNEDRDRLTSFHFIKSFIMLHDPPGIWFILSSPEGSTCPFFFPQAFPLEGLPQPWLFPAHTGRNPEVNLARTLHQTEMICWHVSAYIALWFVTSAVSTANRKHADGVCCAPEVPW